MRRRLPPNTARLPGSLAASLPASLLVGGLIALLAGCERGSPPRTLAGEPSANDVAAIVPQTDWPAAGAGAMHVRRERQYDLTGDGTAETVRIDARGARYEDLDITLVIMSAAGDTLWADGWRSEYYFHYDPLDGKTDEEVARIVRDHVDDLLTDRRFHPQGMPPGMIGGDPTDMMRESVRYHLAELDWRRRVDLEPSEPTPPNAFDRVDPNTVAEARVQVVADELQQGPTYSWFAGGEASYVIGWSVREQAFVRLFACC
jgi:hypothetical protein